MKKCRNVTRSWVARRTVSSLRIALVYFALGAVMSSALAAPAATAKWSIKARANWVKGPSKNKFMSAFRVLDRG